MESSPAIVAPTPEPPRVAKVTPRGTSDVVKPSVRLRLPHMRTQISGQRIFITGGAGFIGSHFVEALTPANDVTVFDNHQRDALRDLKERVRVVHGDVLDAEELAGALRGHDLVIHLAAIAGVRSVGDTVRTMRVNFGGSLNVLEASASAGVRRCVLFSTSEVYGVCTYGATEDEPAAIPAPGDGRWAYAASKLAAEHLAMGFHRSGKVPCVVVRPFNVYGPRQVGEGAVHDMVAAVVAGHPILVRGDGLQIRSWCYVSDLVAGVLGAIEHDAAAGEVLNIGNPVATLNTRMLAETVARAAGGGVRIEQIPASGPDVDLRMPSIDKARRLIGFEPTVGLDEGIRRTLEWARAVRA